MSVTFLVLLFVLSLLLLIFAGWIVVFCEQTMIYGDLIILPIAGIVIGIFLGIMAVASVVYCILSFVELLSGGAIFPLPY